MPACQRLCAGQRRIVRNFPVVPLSFASRLALRPTGDSNDSPQARRALRAPSNSGRIHRAKRNAPHMTQQLVDHIQSHRKNRPTRGVMQISFSRSGNAGGSMAASADRRGDHPAGCARSIPIGPESPLRECATSALRAPPSASPVQPAHRTRLDARADLALATRRAGSGGRVERRDAESGRPIDPGLTR
jgi:hypothetical protein